MKCPYCGKEMTSGYLQAARRIFFTENPHELFFFPAKGEVTISRDNLLSPTCKAFICRSCKKVIADYSNDK